MTKTRFVKQHRFVNSRRNQHGATLIIGLIMIVLITMIVISAFTLSSGNLKSVGNLQVRDESLAAANQAIETVISSPFTTAPVAQSINVDINKDDVVDFVVQVAVPECIKVSMAAASDPSSTELVGMANTSTWNTEWEIDARVNDPASGASVRVRQGVRVLMSESQKNIVCP